MCGLLFGVQKGPKNAFWSPDFACTPCDHRQARRRQHNGVKNFIKWPKWSKNILKIRSYRDEAFADILYLLNLRV